MVLRLLGDLAPEDLAALESEAPMDPALEAGMDPAAMDPAAVVPEMPEDTELADDFKIDPFTAGYLTPELGPFICANCKFFVPESSCAVVAGVIDPRGVCKNFSSLSPEIPEEEMMDEGLALPLAPEGELPLEAGLEPAGGALPLEVAPEEIV